MAERVTVLPDAGREVMLRRAGHTIDGKPKRKRRRRGTSFERRQGMYGR